MKKIWIVLGVVCCGVLGLCIGIHRTAKDTRSYILMDPIRKEW